MELADLVAGLACGFSLSLEVVFMGANALKIIHGGWFPLVVGAVIYTLMSTWRIGRQIMKLQLADSYLPCELFLQDMKNYKPHRVAGTSVFLSGNPTGTPIALLHNLKLNKVLHKQIVLLTIQNKDIPYVDASDRIGVETLEDDCLRITGNYGFMEQPNIPQLLEGARSAGMKVEEKDITFFLSRKTIISTRKRTMPYWRKRLFSALSRNAQSATAFFDLPPSRVVELGMQVEL
jgi:KUP system potassium uptake protein